MPFVVVVAVIGLIGGALLDICSSGQALLAAGATTPRTAGATINGS